MEMVLGGKPVVSAEDQKPRFSCLMWGMAGCGKTTLAATAPGKKLWINFDPDGPLSISGLAKKHANSKVDTILKVPLHVHDMSAEPARIVERFKTDDYLKLGKVLENDEFGIDTVVVDSMTRVSQLAVEAAIASGQHGRATIERPGMSVYGARNALTYRLFVDIFTVTKRHNKNVIFITHEGAPNVDDDGNVKFITMALGGQLPQLGSAQLSEVWYVSDTQKERRIAVRPCRGYKPMKTRMFDATKSPEFVWKYDVNNPDPNYEIATWWNRFTEGGFEKLALPGS